MFCPIECSLKNMLFAPPQGHVGLGVCFPPPLSGVCIFFLCFRGFSQRSPVSSPSPQMCWWTPPQLRMDRWMDVPHLVSSSLLAANTFYWCIFALSVHWVRNMFAVYSFVKGQNLHQSCDKFFFICVFYQLGLGCGLIENVVLSLYFFIGDIISV